jgi:CRP-like cAMP-binding protein
VASAADELKQVPLFSELNQRQLRRLARQFKQREVRSGTSLVRQGEMSGVDFFVIAEGEAAVVVDGKEVGRLKPGDHFGEVALIGERTRMATVTAEGPLRCLVMRSWDFRRFVKENPDVAWKLLQFLVNLLSGQRDPRRRADKLS